MFAFHAVDLIRFIVVAAIGLSVLVAAVIAVVDCSARPERAFIVEGKRNKRFWLLVLGAGLLFAILGALSLISVMFNVIAVVPAAVYWYDVRPAIKRYDTAIGRRRR